VICQLLCKSGKCNICQTTEKVHICRTGLVKLTLHLLFSSLSSLNQSLVSGVQAYYYIGYNKDAKEGCPNLGRFLGFILEIWDSAILNRHKLQPYSLSQLTKPSFSVSRWTHVMPVFLKYAALCSGFMNRAHINCRVFRHRAYSTGHYRSHLTS